MPTKQMTRKRNPRGQGERLRDDIIEAASRLLADPAAPPLTLRAVAREVGVAATSVYLHFDSIETLTLATVNHLFAELLRRQDELTETDPVQRVLAGALVYCEFGLAAPGHYQLIWQQLHGIVSLRISRSKFPWPPLEQTVRAAVEALLATTQNH